MSGRETAMMLLGIQALIGAFDTLYFHEWKARLPALGAAARSELRLHWIRSMIYAFLFALIPWWEPQGLWAGLVLILLLTEIGITVADFIVEDTVRAPLGGVFAGERATHTIMAILHGAILAFWVPVLWEAFAAPTAWLWQPAAMPRWFCWAFVLLSAGVFGSGWRDFYASTGRPGSHWPWPRA